ncbi:TetR/AcrR family transcriptional regulator [Actinacidiphila rubida]|uniref:TetR/AcrR family transcriptional regulator n=1 Tax=Actinacidiphila rubida TaxID=310780 RepID=UPI001FEB7D2D|nr:TetR/AcrR family transcriptional regulator [Actinacidiphila rubida]
MAAPRTATDGRARRTGGRQAAPARVAAAGAAGRRQRERSDATVEDLLTAARALFAADGYAATSLDAVCDRAGVTKGALYHHFSGKQQLFSAVYAREQEHLNARISAAYLAVADDPWEAVHQGSRAYLEASLDPGVQRITLLDAPGALGWEAMLDLGVNCRALTLRGVRRAIELGTVAPQAAEPLASMLYGGLSESAMAIVRSADPKAALEETLAGLQLVFDALAHKG